MTMMRPVLAATLALAVCTAPWLAPAGAPAQLSGARFVPAPSMSLPDYLAPATDPVTHLGFVRVTDPGGTEAGSCGPSYCTHRYSSAQAWNADQSLLLIANGCAGWCFLDGQTYAPRFVRHRSGSCEWHPADPAVMICVTGPTISLWDPRADRDEPVYTTDVYRKLQFGPSKGNPSQDGNRIAVRATRTDGGFDVFVFDFALRRALATIDLDQLPGRNSACTISPSGQYVFCMQDFADGTEAHFIFTADGTLAGRWTEHHRPGHGDMGFDDEGNEVYVGISKSHPDVYQIIKRRLKDGSVASVAPYGEAQHVSLRARTRPQWAVVSYAGNPAEVALQGKWAPFAREVIALRIDGSGEFLRIAQTRNTPHDYWSETHASPSPDGTQVIWSSNWGRPGGPVYDFVSRLPAPLKGAAHSRGMIR